MPKHTKQVKIAIGTKYMQTLPKKKMNRVFSSIGTISTLFFTSAILQKSGMAILILNLFIKEDFIMKNNKNFTELMDELTGVFDTLIHEIAQDADQPTGTAAHQYRAYSNFRPVDDLKKDEVNKSVIDSLRKGNAQLNKENEQLRATIEIKQQSLNTYMASIRQLREGNAQLNKENEQLRATIESLRQDLSISQSHKQVTENRLKEREETIKALRAQVIELRERVRSLENCPTPANPPMMTTPLGLMPVTPSGMRRIVDALSQDEIVITQLRSRMKEYTENMGRLSKENERFEAIFQGIIETLKEFDPKTMDENA